MYDLDLCSGIQASVIWRNTAIIDFMYSNTSNKTKIFRDATLNKTWIRPPYKTDFDLSNNSNLEQYEFE